MEWAAPQSMHWILMSFNNLCIIFYYYDSVFVKRDNAFIVAELPNLNETGIEGGGGVFLHIFLVLINCEVKFGFYEWIPLWINLGV